MQVFQWIVVFPSVLVVKRWATQLANVLKKLLRSNVSRSSVQTVSWDPLFILLLANIITGDEPGHRVRDCPNERTFGKPRAPRECKICSSTEHLAKDCDQRQVMTCRNCNQEGHKAADCDQPRAPRDPATIQCRNCDECESPNFPSELFENANKLVVGHTGRECPKPRDYSRVTCNNCGESMFLSHPNHISLHTNAQDQRATPRLDASNQSSRTKTTLVLVLVWVLEVDSKT